jgi:hypothetical protein
MFKYLLLIIGACNIAISLLGDFNLLSAGCLAGGITLLGLFHIEVKDGN